MTLHLTPHTQPFIWSIRANWTVPNGLYYDPISGEMFSVTDYPYVSYLGRLPDSYTKESQPQMELV